MLNTQLHVKSYFVPSIQNAIQLASREMGPDALLLNARPAPPEARHLGEFEVVFGSYPESRPAEVSDAALTGEIDGLRQQMNEMRNLFGSYPETRPADVPDSALTGEPASRQQPEDEIRNLLLRADLTRNLPRLLSLRKRSRVE